MGQRSLLRGSAASAPRRFFPRTLSSQSTAALALYPSMSRCRLVPAARAGFLALASNCSVVGGTTDECPTPRMQVCFSRPRRVQFYSRTARAACGYPLDVQNVHPPAHELQLTPMLGG